MRKLIFAAIFIAACENCSVGDTMDCVCDNGTYINYCTPDGYYPQCNCYDNGGNGNNPVDTDYNSDSTVIDYYPGCEETYQDNCAANEILIPCTNLCWAKCLTGMTWNNGQCIGSRFIGSYSQVLAECHKTDTRYRIPELEEVAYLLNQCYPDTFSYTSTNYCSPFTTGAISTVINPISYEPFFTTWVGELEQCTNQYGVTDYSCAWYTRFYVTSIIDSDFNFLMANGSYGSALAGGMCVREL